MDRLTLMTAFVAVVQNKSFGAAADRLGVSPSYVSKSVAQLEKSLGVRLLVRTTRRVEITGIGQRYYESCVSILGEVEAADDRVRDMQRNPRGSIILRAPHSFAILYLASAVARFSENYQGIDIALVIDEYPAQSITAMKRGLDLALHLGPSSVPGLAALDLGYIAWSCYASADYVQSHGAPASPDELTEHNCLAHIVMAPDRNWTFGGPRGMQSVKVSGSLSSNSILVLRDAALNGVGVAMLPEFCAASHNGSRSLVKLLPSYSGPKRSLSLVYARDRAVPRRVRVFMDFLVSWFRTPPWSW
jgi:DNA-binding transcriptional LysR family regulator